jgi:hypothetical protein
MYYFFGKYENQPFKLEPSEVEKVGFYSEHALSILKEQEKMNPIHLPVCQMVWEGKYE